MASYPLVSRIHSVGTEQRSLRDDCCTSIAGTQPRNVRCILNYALVAMARIIRKICVDKAYLPSHNCGLFKNSDCIVDAMNVAL
jgi:hypothetical protein